MVSFDCGQKISNALKKDSFFMHKDDVSYRFVSGGAGYLSNEEIKAHARAGHFHDQDFYMLQTLNELHFATADDVLARVRFLSRTGTRRRFVTILTVDDMHSYLRMLAKRGVVYYYLYKITPGSRPMPIYFLTKEGFLLYTSELMIRNEHYDEKTSYKPPFDVFQFLAANRVFSAFIKSPACSEALCWPMQSTLQGKHIFRNHFYALASLQDERFKHVYVFEPVHFETPTDKLTFEENYVRVRNRVFLLKDMVNAYSAEFKDNELIFIVFIVENSRGMKNLLNIIKEDDDHLFWENTALITSDYCVCESFQGDFYNALFGIKYVGVNIAVSQSRPYVDMKLPTAWKQLSGDE